MNNWYDILPLSQIDPRVFVSGYAQAAHLIEENPYRITAVLNVHQGAAYRRAPGIIYAHIPFNDGEEIPVRQFTECLAWLKFMSQHGHTILIHCAAGISRSVAICASFLHYMGMADFDTALDRIRKARPVASPAPATIRSAKRMLGAYPYDGSFETIPDLRLTHDAVEAIHGIRAAASHTDLDCPMRQFLLSPNPTDIARHEIPCSCAVLEPTENFL